MRVVLDDRTIEEALQLLVETIQAGQLKSAGAQIEALNLGRFKRSSRFGIDRVENTLEALEECKWAIVGNDHERALAYGERAQQQWSAQLTPPKE